MPNLISEAQKAAWSSVFNDIHDTFARDIYIYMTAERTDISTNEEYNFAYRGTKQGSALSYNTNIVSGTFPARVMWKDPTKEDNWTEINPKIPGNLCRLKLAPEALSYISGAKSVYIDGKPCEMMGNIRPHGLFNIQFYTIFLKEKEMNKADGEV